MCLNMGSPHINQGPGTSSFHCRTLHKATSTTCSGIKHAATCTQRLHPCQTRQLQPLRSYYNAPLPGWTRLATCMSDRATSHVCALAPHISIEGEKPYHGCSVGRLFCANRLISLIGRPLRFEIPATAHKVHREHVCSDGGTCGSSFHFPSLQEEAMPSPTVHNIVKQSVLSTCATAGVSIAT
jgi:hypothetical protein